MFQHFSALKLPCEANVRGKKIVTSIGQKKCQGNLQHIAISTNNLHRTVRQVLFMAHALRRLYWRPGAHLKGEGRNLMLRILCFTFKTTHVIKSRCKYKCNITRFATVSVRTQTKRHVPRLLHLIQIIRCDLLGS